VSGKSEIDCTRSLAPFTSRVNTFNVDVVPEPLLTVHRVHQSHGNATDPTTNMIRIVSSSSGLHHLIDQIGNTTLVELAYSITVELINYLLHHRFAITGLDLLLQFVKGMDLPKVNMPLIDIGLCVHEAEGGNNPRGYSLLALAKILQMFGFLRVVSGLHTIVVLTIEFREVVLESIANKLDWLLCFEVHMKVRIGSDFIGLENYKVILHKPIKKFFLNSFKVWEFGSNIDPESDDIETRLIGLHKRIEVVLYLLGSHLILVNDWTDDLEGGHALVVFFVVVVVILLFNNNHIIKLQRPHYYFCCIDLSVLTFYL